MIGIYKITSPTGRIYIGQSRNIEQRFKEYKLRLGKNQINLHNSFLKHGVDNHTFEVIEECDFELLNERERYWQDFYKVTSKKGLNCILTGTKTKPYVMTEESRLRRSASQKGIKISEEGKKNISIAMKKRILTKEQLEAGTKRLVEANKKRAGRVLSAETKTKIRNFNLGKKHPERSGFNHHNSKTVLCLNTGVFYGSAKQASEAYEIKYYTLKSKLSGKIKNNTNLIYV